MLNFVVQNEFLRGDEGTLFFGGEEIALLDKEQTMLDVLVNAGVFSSKGQAKKNGWADKATIPPGLSCHVVGKLRHHIWILNPTVDNLISGE